MTGPRRWLAATGAILLGALTIPLAGQTSDAVTYRLSFPAPQHRWLAVDVEFSDLPSRPLTVRMSSASPGRYARHEFAKNLIEITFAAADGSPAAVEHRGPGHWVVSGHGGGVRVRYRLFGDRVDGTYLGVDSTHAHMNMPATLVWAEDLEERAARVTLVPPPDRGDWRAATQLYPTSDPLVFTAPNLAYLLDSPIEFGPIALRSFTVADPADPSYEPTFRLAVHHADGDPPLAAFAQATARVVEETVAVFGEFPRFETDTYTFIADYLPTASSDAMEHRNSTVLTASSGIASPRARTQRLGAVAHEFFHVWNVERIRTRSLEPFDFTGANVSGELWLAEGVTNYYGALVLARAELVSLDATLDRFARVINMATLDPGRRLRSVVEMSRMAPYTDAATAIDPTNFDNTFISYYWWGEAIGLGLDLALRRHSNGAVTLDDYMRALWRRFGAPGGPVPGVVGSPYTADDARAVLGEVAGDTRFAAEFFDRYIDGREVVDYAALLEHAGIETRPLGPGRATLGDDALNRDLTIGRLTRYGSPLHEAGLDRGDVVVAVDGERVSSRADLARQLRRRQPGETVTISYRRAGVRRDAMATLGSDLRIGLVPIETTGGRLTASQRAFRESWLGTRRRP